jgi:hypothetical protein
MYKVWMDGDYIFVIEIEIEIEEELDVKGFKRKRL